MADDDGELETIIGRVLDWGREIVIPHGERCGVIHTAVEQSRR